MRQKMLIFIIGILLLSNFVIAQETNVGMQQIQQCEPNSYACSFDNSGSEVIKKCNSEGTLYEITKTCESYEECHLTLENTAECIYKDKRDSSSNYLGWGIAGIFLIILIIVLTRKKK